jgi:hypothetical protein
MPETYNPRERTFIKPPEVKCCPECGQPLPSDVKPMNNIMNSYISSSGNRMVMNSDANTVEVKGVTLYKAKQNPVTKKWESEFMPVSEGKATGETVTPNPVIPQDVVVEKTPILGVPAPVPTPAVPVNKLQTAQVVLMQQTSNTLCNLKS